MGATTTWPRERIPSHEAYQWMVDFVDEMVAPADEHAAETLSMAFHGKGAFRRFKDTFYRVDDQWLFKWRHFQVELVLLCIRRYLRYPLSYRDLEEMIRERRLHIDQTTIYRSRAMLRTRTGAALQTSSQVHERLVGRR